MMYHIVGNRIVGNRIVGNRIVGNRIVGNRIVGIFSKENALDLLSKLTTLDVFEAPHPDGVISVYREDGALIALLVPVK